MPHELTERFHWCDFSVLDNEELFDTEKYKMLVNWSIKARGKNPAAFDSLTEWMLDDACWGGEKLAENKQILMNGTLARFSAQNARLRAYLMKLEPSGVVNTAAFNALDRFDDELSGAPHEEKLRETVAKVFADFTHMHERSIREQIAGCKTGLAGTDHVDLFGYINSLKNCDAQVQWALFMPDLVARQQKGFKVDSFEYKTLPAMRFIGRESDDLADIETRKELFQSLDAMQEHKTDFDKDVLFMHHYGLGVDVGAWHGVWGRFMKADAPVPEGFIYFDFMPEAEGNPGPPYCSQFAYAVFSGDAEAMHSREGFDSDAMYDVTRNIILSQGVVIPYPEKYWAAEVFTDGCDRPSSAYMFGVIL